MIRSLDFLTLRARLMFIKLRQALIKTLIPTTLIENTIS